MKKRLFTVLLMLVLCVSVLSITALADGDPAIVAQGTCGDQGDNVTWVLNNNGVLTLTGSGAIADSTLTGGLVQPWTDYINDIKTVVVGDGITYIGNYSFKNCTALESVSLASSVAQIGQQAFEMTNALKQINLSNVSSFGLQSFNQSGLENITLSNVMNIEKGAFLNCTSLVSVVLGDGSSREIVVGESAFQNSTGQMTVEFKNPTALGNLAFKGCAGLSSIDLTNVTSLGESVFSGTSGLSSVKWGNLDAIPSGTFYGTALTRFMIPSNVKTIGNSAFYGSALTEIVIPSTVETVEGVAFRACTSLTKVTIEPGLTTIVNGTFRDCTALAEMTIPKSVTTVEDRAFQKCNPFTVYYSGTEEDWGQINIGSNNDALKNSTIIFKTFADEKPTVKAETEKKTGKIKLTITAVDGAKSYKIFVSEQPNGTYKEAATVTGTAYTYSGTPGKTYYFKVQAVNDKGELSGESNIVSKVRLPAQVTSLKATSKKKQVTLKWKKVTGAKKYVIYMSKNGKSGWKKVGTTTKTQYVYKKGTVGKKLYFKVQALTANNKKGEFSKVVSIKVKK